MKTIGLSLLLAGTFALGAAAPANADTVNLDNGVDRAPSAGSSAKPSRDTKRYCITDNVTGSRIPVKTCKTRKEWHAEGVEIPADR
jgi:hypothetical protein